METLFFLLEQLYRMTGIPIRCLDSSGRLMLFNRGYEQEHDPFNHGIIKKQVFSVAAGRQSPFIEVEEEIYAYSCLKDTTECVIIIGPVTLFAQSQEKKREYAEKRGVPPEHLFITKRGMIELVSAISMLYFARYGKTITGNELLTERAGEQVSHEKDMYVLSNVDEDFYRSNYELERIFVEQIRNGDVSETVFRSDSKEADAIVGKMAHNPVKRFEYMVCVSICLASRAAMEGGVAPAVAYDMSDILFRRLERCNDISEMLYLSQIVRKTFAEQVRLAKQARSEASYVEKCKIYIGQNLNIPFTLDNIANSINVNKHHLSRKFSQEEGMTIMEYARRKRIQTAANMLKYSDEKISAIAAYLTFPDQSHFGKVFKEIMGTTPKQYRSSNRLIEVH